MIQPQVYTVPFIKKIEVAKKTYSFYFRRPTEFDFVAGQYNRWTLPIIATDGRGASRYFTISSPPSEKDTFVFTTEIIQSDFKKKLLELKIGQKIKIFGPMGNFILDEENENENVFIAGGIGITPFHSILTEAAAKNNAKSMILFVSFSVPEEAIFLDELTQITNNYPNLKVVYTITKPEESQVPWPGETGRISDIMIKKYVKDISKSIFYLVGPPPMVEEAKKLFEEMKIVKEYIKSEQFTGY